MRMSLRIGLVYRVALVLAAAMGLGRASLAAPDDTQALHDALIDWLECVECDRGELGRVAGFKSRATLSLDNVLRQGPSQATLLDVEQSADIRYTQLLVARRRANLAPPAESRPDFVKRNLAAYSDRYRARAAIALAEIGGPNALRSLCRARAADSAVLREAVQGALAKLDRKCP